MPISGIDGMVSHQWYILGTNAGPPIITQIQQECHAAAVSTLSST